MKFSLKIPVIESDRHSRSRSRTILWGILVLGAILRFSYLIQVQANPLPRFTAQDNVFDSFNYFDLANDILDHHFLGSKIIQQSPVYPYFIAVIFKLFGREINYVFVFQILWGLTAVYLFYRTASLVFKNHGVGLVAAFIAAVYSPFIYHEALILRDLPIAYMNLLGFYLLLRADEKQKGLYYFLAGAALGLSTVIRPHVVTLSILGIFFLVRGTKPKLIAATLMILGVCAVISTVAIRNRMLGSQALIESSAPETFWGGNTFDSEGIGAPRSTLAFKFAEEAGASGSYLMNSLRILRRELSAHPQEYFDLYLRKFKMILNGYEIPENFSYDLFKENHSVLSIAFLDFSYVSPLAIVGMIIAWRKFREARWLYIFLFVTTAFVLLFHIQGRYRLCFIPFFILFAAYAVYWIFQMVRQKSFVPVAVVLPAVILISLYTKPDQQIMEKYFGGRVREIDYNNMVIACLDKIQKQGSSLTSAERERLFKLALENRKKSVQAAALHSDLFGVFLFDLGRMQFQAGEYKDAVENLSTFLSLYPQNHDAQALRELAKERILKTKEQGL